MADLANTDMVSAIATGSPGVRTKRSSKTSLEDAVAFFKTQEDDFAHVKKMYRFFRKSDPFDSAIADAIESFLGTPPELGAPQFSLSDVADDIYYFPRSKLLLAQNFSFGLFFLFVCLPMLVPTAC